MRRLTPLLFLAALAACADGAPSPTDPNLARIHEAEDSHGGTPYRAVLLPELEPLPAGGDPNPAASGVVLLTLNSGQEEICFEATFSGLTGLVSDAHIHVGPTPGPAGRIVVRLGAPAAAPFPAATSGSIAQCVPASREIIKAIRQDPANYYVNIHTKSTPAGVPPLPTDRPGGAIRGPLEKTQGSEVNQG